MERMRTGKADVGEKAHRFSWKRLMVEGLAVLAIGAAAAMTFNKREAPEPNLCQESLWDHVYIPARLYVLDPCMEVKGTIASVDVSADGDYHIRLKPDPGFEGLLNWRNKSAQGGALVVEPVCMNRVEKWYARGACRGVRQDIEIPPVGTHVSAIGSYVLDLTHGWREIHPVTSITPIP